MKKKFGLLLLSIIMCVAVVPLRLHSAAVSRFFLQHRMGPLIRVDPASAYKGRYAEKKGPRLDEIPVELSPDDMLYYERRLEETGKGHYSGVLKKAYEQGENGTLVLKYSLDDAKTIQVIREKAAAQRTFLLDFRVIKRATWKRLLKKLPTDEADWVKNLYEPGDDGKAWLLKADSETLDKLEKVRGVFLHLNGANEIPMDFVENYGTPMPHNFPRVHFAKSKALVDIQLAWGARIENPSVPGNFTVGFALNIQNFTMFSLELITFKYNFKVPGVDIIEPYVGFALYGGYADGFPIGFNMLAGFDIYPVDDFITGGFEDHSFFVSGEVRLGPVLYIPTYFDTGLDTETIYKKAVFLIENGYYFGVGYIFK
jgi:hypothetical protein